MNIMETIKNVDSSSNFREDNPFEEVKNIKGGGRSSKIKKWLRKPSVIVVVTIFLLIGAVWAGKNYFGGSAEEDNKDNKTAKIVKVSKIDLNAQNSSEIKTVGTVKAETKVDVVSLGKGTIRGLFFEVGDQVKINQVLLGLHSNTALTSFNNAQVSFFNLQNNLDSTVRITEESIRQAEIGVKNAEESVRLAEITRKTAQDSLDNTKNTQAKNILDTQDGAIISFFSYLNTANTALGQIDYIIKAEGGVQLPGIADVLAAGNSQSLVDAKENYFRARDKYNELIKVSSTRNSIAGDIKEAQDLLNKTKQAVDDAIIVLNYTITSLSFSEATLSTQRTSFATLRNTVVTAQAGAETTLNSLENLDLTNKTALDTAENAVSSVESQLQLAQVGLDNARANLSSAVQVQEQQVISAQTTLDSAEGQLNLAGNQLTDLTIKAPIKGKVTGKFVELGAEINPGQKIAEISQTAKLKIAISLPSEDIYRIKLGQTVKIGDKLEGVINSIDPAADPITRKVKAEILFDNKDNELIQGTFVDVIIPLEEVNHTSKDSIFIPLRAITVTQSESFVFVNENNLAVKRLVEIGQVEGVMIEVVEGLKDGDEVIVDGNKSLEENDLVIVD